MEVLSISPTLSVPVPHWYAVSVRSRYEKKSHAELLERGVESFLPLIEEVHVWSDRKKKVMEPIFRGYLFVRTDLGNWMTILQTEGVVRFVRIGARLSWIPESQMEPVRILAGYPSRIKKECYLASGERVKVISGPFKGIEGIIMRIKGSTRVVVSLDSIVQSVSVDVAPEMLVPIRERKPAAENETPMENASGSVEVGLLTGSCAEGVEMPDGGAMQAVD